MFSCRHFWYEKTAGTLRKKSWAHLQITRALLITRTLLGYDNKKYPFAKFDAFICSVTYDLY